MRSSPLLPLPLLLSLSLWWLTGWTAQAQSALDYFNNGAQSYISNNIPNAKSIVEQGLKTYPGDDKLTKLKKLLDQQQQQQQQNQQQQQQNQSQSQQQQQSQQKQDQKNQQKQDQQQQQPQQNSEDKQKQDEQKQAEQKKDQDQQKKSAQKSEDPKDQDKKDGQAAEAAKMTPEDAKRLLDAQKTNEKIFQPKSKDKADQLKKILPDW